MILRNWEDLPAFMKCDEVKEYYDILAKKKGALRLKRGFDVVVATIMLVILAIPMLIIAIMIKIDSPGPVFYRQERVTTYGKRFKIHKFRTMVNNADKIGSAVTVGSDVRITKVGSKLRNLRIDEIPQLIDVLAGDMSFVGTRPEVVKYVMQYKSEFMATLLMPAGITSECSIRYKDENKLLENVSVEKIDKIYVEDVLSRKMEINLRSVKEFSLLSDLGTLFGTVIAVLRKEYV